MDGLQPLIAIVDDEECVRKALERLLRAAGMRVKIYPSGTAFLGALESLSVDCVVLDLHMSGASGFDVLAALAKAGSQPPVIVLTGHDTANARNAALAGGARDYLTKPIDEPVLLDAIEQALSAPGFVINPGKP